MLKSVVPNLASLNQISRKSAEENRKFVGLDKPGGADCAVRDDVESMTGTRLFRVFMRKVTASSSLHTDLQRRFK